MIKTGIPSLQGKKYRKTLFLEFFVALVLVLSSSAYALGWYFTLKVEQLLDEHISSQLKKCLESASDVLPTNLLGILKPGDEKTSLYRYLRKQSFRLMGLLGASSVIVLNRNSCVVVSVPYQYFIGQEYPIVQTDLWELKKAWNGQIVCSQIYRLENESFKTGYAPIKNEKGETLYILCIEIGASKKDVLQRLQDITVVFSLIGAAIAFFVSMMLWLSLTYPLRRLTVAMEAVSQNLYKGDLTTGRRDELGFLIDRFNFMLASLREKEIEVTRMYERELQRKKHLALLGEFSAGVAHEIRNPLSAMEGFAGLLERKLQEPDKKNLVKRLIEEIHILNNIVVQILTYARETPWNPAHVSIFSLIQDILSMTIVPEMAKNIKVQLTLDPQIPTIFVDAQEIRKALINLIRNSLEAMEKSTEKTLTIRTSKENSQIRLTIADTGGGIPKDSPILQAIFKPFYTTKENGTGLGLPIAYKIIEQNHGQIKIESEVGKGTEIHILFPAG